MRPTTRFAAAALAGLALALAGCGGDDEQDAVTPETDTNRLEPTGPVAPQERREPEAGGDQPGY